MNEFTSRYKDLSNTELLEIILNSGNYQDLAIKTAKKEIESRNLSENKIDEAKREIELKKNENNEQEIKWKEKRKIITQPIKSFFKTINPIQNEIEISERIIRLTILVFGIIAVFKIYINFNSIRFFFYSPVNNWGFSTIFFLLSSLFSMIFLPTTIYLFWKQRKIGWVLMSVFLSYSTIGAIGLFFLNFDREPSDIPALEALNPYIPPYIYIFTILFFTSILIAICKNNIRNKYKITNGTMYRSIGFTLIFYLIYIMIILNL